MTRIRNLTLAIAALLVAALPAFSQASCDSTTNHHFAAGIYSSIAYNTYSARVFSGNSATGSQTITLRDNGVRLCDGYILQPFATTVPITIGIGSNAETVTPSAVSGCAVNGPLNSCTITATFSNLHGPGELVVSGDAGIQEAINDAAAATVPGVVYWQIDPGIVTLNTGGANTTLGSVNIPTRSVVLAASAKVTTTIGTCAGGWSLGFSTGTEFTAANTTLTAGTTTDSSTLTQPLIMSAAATAPIAHCTTSNASAGAIHARFVGYKVVAPAN